MHVTNEKSGDSLGDKAVCGVYCYFNKNNLTKGIYKTTPSVNVCLPLLCVAGFKAIQASILRRLYLQNCKGEGDIFLDNANRV